MFDPGHLQFEATEVSNAEPSATLSDAIQEGDVEKVQRLLKAGSPVNILDEHMTLP